MFGFDFILMVSWLQKRGLDPMREKLHGIHVLSIGSSCPGDSCLCIQQLFSDVVLPKSPSSCVHTRYGESDAVVGIVSIIMSPRATTARALGTQEKQCEWSERNAKWTLQSET